MSKRNLLIGLVGAVIVLAGAVWFFFLRSDAPPPASIESLADSVTTTVNPAAPATTVPTESVRDGLDGAWTADKSVSFVGYRIDEELASLGAITAVGRTGEVDATLSYAGTQVLALEVTVDMTTVKSDRSRRDDAMKSRGLETDSFPEATFSLTAPIELGAVPVEGAGFTATATGDLTLHGVTQPITLDLDGVLLGDTLAVAGSVEIALADYAIEKPTGFSVLGIADVGLLEIELAFIPG